MRNCKKAFAVVLSFAMVLGTVMVTPKSADAAKVNVKSVKVKAPYSKTAYVAKGKSIKLSTQVSVTPNKSANKKVTFKSNKKSVATVSSKGVVKGKKTGTAKITVTSKKNKKKKTTVTVKVVKGAVKKVKLNKSKAALNVGQTLSLKKTISASKGASKRVYWTSSRARVASVSQRGVVTAKAAGTATITAKATDGSNKKATCKVTVSQPVVTTSIIGMKVMSNYSISFTLDRPCALDTNSVVVKKKRYANGPYHYTMKVDSIQTSDMV